MGALSGIKVLDLVGSIAAGYCGKLFADQGADVLLVEPPEGFATRRLPPFAPGVDGPEASGMHAYLSANKRSVIPSGEAELLRLTRGATLVIDGEPAENRPLPLATLAEVAPNATLLSITWFGQDGPYRDFVGTDGVCQALTSHLDWLGEPGEEPLLPGGYQAQIIAGVTAFIAAMARVLAAELGNASGPAQLDVSVLEANLCFTEIEFLRGYCGKPTRTRAGVNRFRSTYPLGIYPCRDGWLGVTVLTPGQWSSFCRLLGFDDLERIEAYRASVNRLRDANELDARIAARVRNESAAELSRKGQAMRIPLAIVPTMEQLFGVDQYVARGAFAAVSHPDLGALQLPVTPFRLHAAPAELGGPVSRLGADTQAALAEAEAAR